MKSQPCVNAWRSRTGISLKNVVEYCKLYQFLNKNAALLSFCNVPPIFLLFFMAGCPLLKPARIDAAAAHVVLNP